MFPVRPHFAYFSPPDTCGPAYEAKVKEMLEQNFVTLRRQTRGSKNQDKIRIKVAGLGVQNKHQFAPGSHEICT